jgi:hypothetical protein
MDGEPADVAFGWRSIPGRTFRYRPVRSECDCPTEVLNIHLFGLWMGQCFEEPFEYLCWWPRVMAFERMGDFVGRHEGSARGTAGEKVTILAATISLSGFSAPRAHAPGTGRDHSARVLALICSD